MVSSNGPLDGVRVIDFTERMQGPYATQMLADMGADVVKVERRVSLTPDGRPDDRYGENMRYGIDREDSKCYPAGFLACNRNKRSITIDLKHPEGLRVAHALIADADVVYENFRPGVMDRLGVGYENCAAINAGVVYASASGYGPDGPYESRPGQDVLAQAISGFGAVNADADGRPLPVAMAVGDMLGAMNGAFAVAAALLHRERTGEGQHIHVNLLDSLVASLSEWAFHFLNTAAGEPARRTKMHANPYTPPPYGFYKTKDSHIALSSGRQIRQLGQIIGIEGLADDDRFNEYWARDDNREVFEALIEEALQAKTTNEWLALMDAQDLFVAPVHSFEEAFSDPQVLHNEMVVPLDTPIGPLRFVGVPFKLSKTPASVRTAPPLHGEHTEQILDEIGVDADEIARLREIEAI